MSFDHNSRVLITGGTGSFGQKFTEVLLKRYPQIDRIVIFSRDELKQWEMQQKFPKEKYPQLRFFLGDIRDKERLISAFERIDTVVHAAALKQVPTAEYNPIEFIYTNVLGSENIVRAALAANVKRVIALSTDKAAAPINLYGATKLCADKLFIAANNIKGFRDLTFSVVRYGNVMGSRGSVIPFFLKEAKKGILPITDINMTRFNLSLLEGVEMVLTALKNTLGGELFVPKMPSYKITDLADAIGPNCKKILTGVRPGEKIHEDLITSSDSINTYDCGKYYIILPSNKKYYQNYIDAGRSLKNVENGFSYTSGTNPNFLNVNELKYLISNNIE